MDLKLTGKIALVTGSTAGIGLQSAQSMEQKSLEHVRPLSLLTRFATVDELQPWRSRRPAGFRQQQPEQPDGKRFYEHQPNESVTFC
jgi:hypothetical protein